MNNRDPEPSLNSERPLFNEPWRNENNEEARDELTYSTTSIVEEAEMLTGSQLRQTEQLATSLANLTNTEFGDLITRMQRSDSQRFYQF